MLGALVYSSGFSRSHHLAAWFRLVISALALLTRFIASRAARNPSTEAVRYPRRNAWVGFSLDPPCLFGLSCVLVGVWGVWVGWLVFSCVSGGEYHVL